MHNITSNLRQACSLTAGSAWRISCHHQHSALCCTEQVVPRSDFAGPADGYHALPARGAGGQAQPPPGRGSAGVDQGGLSRPVTLAAVAERSRSHPAAAHVERKHLRMSLCELCPSYAERVAPHGQAACNLRRSC